MPNAVASSTNCVASVKQSSSILESIIIISKMKQRFKHKTNLDEELLQNSNSDSRTNQNQKTLPHDLEEQDDVVVIPTKLSEKIYNEAKDQVQELQTDQSQEQSGLSSFVKGSLQAKLAK